ncbi:MAG: aminotransferase class I/II-fold pyridoxal phosphate-dependent enzyme [Candidatus Thermoplasmatota archaeon]|nr:aminotransferase class I/II-fold pyridoxal phosphate-dependent enzyme [Candidatus Thermoplasmatota archaeon]
MLSDDSGFRETVDPPRFSLTFPIYQTSAFKLPEGDHYRYGREKNPTVEELERIISFFEGTPGTTCFSSGMGAISTTLLTLVEPGGSLVIPLDLFARTRAFTLNFLKKWNVDVKVTGIGTDSILSAISEGSVVLVESMSNPILRLYDLEKIARAVHAKNGILISDSTFATPVNLKGCAFGSDVSIHSLSKFIGGHNDIIGGSASGNQEIISRIDLFRRTIGTNMDPNTAFLAIRGLKTLSLRMERINSSAMKIARKLEEEGIFDHVIYPGLESHPDHQVASRMMNAYGGVISFHLKERGDKPLERLKSLSLIEPANTLGSVGTVISHPMTMSHRSLSKMEFNELGIDEYFFRLSVGTEDPELILKDLRKMA